MSFWRQSVRISTNLLHHSLRPVTVTDSKNIKRWVAPTLRELAKRRKNVEPEPERPRSSYLEWNYDIEVRCFAKRLGEKFDEKILKEAFVQREWANLEDFKAKDSGEDVGPLSNNHELAQEGIQLITQSVKNFYSKSYPEDLVNAITNYLTTDEMLAHIAKHLGFKDLVKSKEYPPETRSLADAFKAIVAALSYSDADRVDLFVKDFVIAQMNGKDVYDIWNPEKPYDYLLKLLQQRGIQEVEPRLCNKSAINTILANYQVGIYDSRDKNCLGMGWGESVQIAKDTAALNAIQRIYGC